MITKHTFYLLLISLVIVACKQENKVEVVQEPEATVSPFTVLLDVNVKKDDNFHMYYTEDNSINFTEEKSLWYPVTGAEDNQEIIFKLPADVYPTNIRFDLGYGKNENQIEIIINKIRFSNNEKFFEIKSSDISSYFYPNKDNTSLDVQSGSVKRLEVNQETAPSLYPHLKLTEELMKLIK